MTDHLQRQRENRRKTGNLATKKYEKTPNGFLMRLYRNMQSRVCGSHKLKAHLYEGLPILRREEFYAWTKSSDIFWELFRDWEQSGYERRLTPSVDRIDTSRGYELDNMEWVPFYINCSRGAITRNSM